MSRVPRRPGRGQRPEPNGHGSLAAVRRPVDCRGDCGRSRPTLRGGRGAVARRGRGRACRVSSARPRRTAATARFEMLHEPRPQRLLTASTAVTSSCSVTQSGSPQSSRLRLGRLATAPEPAPRAVLRLALNQRATDWIRAVGLHGPVRAWAARPRPALRPQMGHRGIRRGASGLAVAARGGGRAGGRRHPPARTSRCRQTRWSFGCWSARGICWPTMSCRWISDCRAALPLPFNPSVRPA